MKRGMGPKTRECEGDFSPSLRTCVIPIQSSVLAVCCFVAFCWCSKNTRIIGNLEVNKTDGLTFFLTSTRRRFLGTFKFVSATFYKNNNLSSCILNEVEKQKYSYQVSQNMVLPRLEPRPVSARKTIMIVPLNSPSTTIDLNHPPPSPHISVESARRKQKHSYQLSPKRGRPSS